MSYLSSDILLPLSQKLHLVIDSCSPPPPENNGENLFYDVYNVGKVMKVFIYVF